MYPQEQPSPPRKTSWGGLLCIGIVGALMCGQGAFFWATAEETSIDSVEKRRLATFPKATFKSVSSGQFTRSVERYVNDRFPFRNTLLDAGYWLREKRGVAYQGQRLFHNTKSHDALEGVGDRGGPSG